MPKTGSRPPKTKAKLPTAKPKGGGSNARASAMGLPGGVPDLGTLGANPLIPGIPSGKAVIPAKKDIAIPPRPAKLRK